MAEVGASVSERVRSEVGTGRASAHPEGLSPAARTAVRSLAVAFGLREHSSRFSLSCGRKGGSFAAALLSSYRCTMTL